MTVEVILNKIIYLRIHNVSIHINLYQNQFINKCVEKNFLKFPLRQTERLSFFVRCRKLTFLIILKVMSNSSNVVMNSV